MTDTVQGGPEGMATPIARSADQETPEIAPASAVQLNRDMPTSTAEATGENKDWGDRFCC